MGVDAGRLLETSRGRGVGVQAPLRGRRTRCYAFYIAGHHQSFNPCDYTIKVSQVKQCQDRRLNARVSYLHRGRDERFSVTPAGAPWVMTPFPV